MDFQHRMKRMALGTIVQRSIRDLQTDPQRALRRLTDLGENSMTGAGQKQFIQNVQAAIQRPDSPCYALLTRVAHTANMQTLRMLSMNLGYTACTYGARLLRVQQESLHHKIPAVLVFDWRGAGQNRIAQRVPALIEDATQMGVFTYVLMLEESFAQLNAAVEQARLHSECTFVLGVLPANITEDTACLLGQQQNVMLILQDAPPAAMENACQLLGQNQCIYGCGSLVGEENVKTSLDRDLLLREKDWGAMYHVFVCEEESGTAQRQLSAFTAASRQDPELDIFPFDWQTDISYVVNTFSAGSDYMLFYRDGTVSSGQNRQNRPALTTLRQAIIDTMPSC